MGWFNFDTYTMARSTLNEYVVFYKTVTRSLIGASNNGSWLLLSARGTHVQGLTKSSVRANLLQAIYAKYQVLSKLSLFSTRVLKWRQNTIKDNAKWTENETKFFLPLRYTLCTTKYREPRQNGRPQAIRLHVISTWQGPCWNILHKATHMVIH